MRSYRSHHQTFTFMQKFLIYIFLAFNITINAQAPNWTVDYSLYEYNMVITGVVELNDSLIVHSEGLIVGAFVGIECRGAAEYKTYDFIEGSRINMSVYSNNNNDIIELKAYLPTEDTIVNIEQSFNFTNLGRVGSLENPTALDIKVMEWAKPSKPEIPVGPTQICQGNTTSTYTINTLDNTSSYNWEIIPDTAAEIIGDSTHISIVWNAQYYGKAYLCVNGINKNGQGKLSDSLEIVVANTPEKPVISEIETNILQSSVENGNQWYLDGIGAIAGATEQNYIVTISGNYYVIVENDGCVSEPSNKINITVTGINNKNQFEFLKVYPNPGKGIFNIAFKNHATTEYNLQLFSQTGVLVYSTTCSSHETKCDFSEYKPGLYILKATQKNAVYISNLIIQ